MAITKFENVLELNTCQAVANERAIKYFHFHVSKLHVCLLKLTHVVHMNINAANSSISSQLPSFMYLQGDTGGRGPGLS